MLHELEKTLKFRHEGFCWIIKELFTEMCFEDSWDVKPINWFPELIKRKPKNPETSWGLWFYNDNEGRIKRMKILKQCIIETY